jgi:hypothetical protein
MNIANPWLGHLRLVSDTSGLLKSITPLECSLHPLRPPGTSPHGGRLSEKPILWTCKCFWFHSRLPSPHVASHTPHAWYKYFAPLLWLNFVCKLDSNLNCGALLIPTLVRRRGGGRFVSNSRSGETVHEWARILEYRPRQSLFVHSWSYSWKAVWQIPPGDGSMPATGR